MRKKIIYISGTRADFGLMTPVLKAIAESKKLSLKVYATGIHLTPEFGFTFKEVKKSFPEAGKIKAIFEKDSRQGMADFAGKFLFKVIEILKKESPDLVLLLGDRVEMLCVATACLYLGIPTAHIHGGEKTSTVDELARHAITKLTSIHFAATKKSAERIKKMGEEGWRIQTVGAPALDVILNEKLLGRGDLFKKIGLNPKEKLALITQHPVSEEHEQAGKQMREILAAVKKIGLPAVIIYPHADAGGKRIIQAINKEKNNPLFRIFPSLPYREFLALEKEAAVWIGNSSAAMIESSSFKTPVVNVGNRQFGRENGGNVINASYDRKAIGQAIKKSLFDQNYLAKLTKIKNPWGDGRASGRIVKFLENLKIDKRLLAKQISY